MASYFPATGTQAAPRCSAGRAPPRHLDRPAGWGWGVPEPPGAAGSPELGLLLLEDVAASRGGNGHYSARLLRESPDRLRVPSLNPKVRCGRQCRPGFLSAPLGSPGGLSLPSRGLGSAAGVGARPGLGPQVRAPPRPRGHRPRPGPAPRAHLHVAAAPPGAAKATCPCPPWAALVRAIADPQVTG